ncbi:hypothetical protein D3C81_1675570 [compost metagenome]
MVDLRHRVLPEQIFLRDFRAQVARARTHVAVGQLEPCAGEGIGELVGMFQEAPRDLFVLGVETQRQVRGQHRRPQLLRRVVCMRDGFAAILGHPLVGAGRALGRLPIVAEQVFQVAVAPLRRRLAPGHLQPAGNGVGALAAAVGA